MPSTGTEHRNLQKSSASGSSSSFKSVLTVTYTRTLRSRAKSTASRISSREKFTADALAENSEPPMYTASAPANTAAFRAAGLPAGASTSIFFVFTRGLLYVCLFEKAHKPRFVAVIGQHGVAQVNGRQVERFCSCRVRCVLGSGFRFFRFLFRSFGAVAA